MEKRQAERTEYLLITVQNYISSLRLNSSSWDKTLAIPTHKFLPPMYELAARLGTSGNLNQLVQQLITKTAKEQPYHGMPVLMAPKNA